MSTDKTSTNIVITVSDSTSKEKESKHKEQLSKKLKKIGTLKKQIEKITTVVNTARKLYIEHIAEQEKEFLAIKEKLVVKLFERFQQKSFALWQKDIIENKLTEEIQFLFNKGYQSEVLTEVQNNFMNILSEKLSDDEKEHTNNMAKEYMKEMGFDVDDEQFDFTDPNFREKFQEDYINQHAESEEQERHAHQQNKTQNTDKEFQKLYRSLVKKVHPDLVTDSKEKEQGEAWMKELSLVWEKRDYYQLLILKKEIDKDDSIEVELDRTQFTSLISQLNTEIRDLEYQKYVLKEEHPDTTFYYNAFYAKSEKGMLKKINNFKIQLEHYMEETEEELSFLKTQKSTKAFLEEISRDDEQDMLAELLSEFEF